MIPLKAKIKSVFPLSAAVLILLIAAKVAWKPANQLLYITGLIYLVCLMGFWLVNRTSENLSWSKSFYLPLTWILTTIILLGGVYRYDRAGWNWYKFTGYNVTLSENIPQADVPITEFVQKHPIFSIDPSDSETLLLKSGEYEIDKSIVVPRGGSLRIEPGVTLKFAVGRSLISYRPIIAKGTKENHIRFVSQDSWRKWGVIGVVRTGKSIFEYADFRDGRQARVNNIDFFAMLSIIHSNVEISHCEFLDSFGKDAINVRYGEVVMENNTIINTYKDGIDLDGGSGVIRHNKFVNCEDEGIDLSENELVQVYENEILDNRGGSIGADVNLDVIKAQNVLGFYKH